MPACASLVLASAVLLGTGAAVRSKMDRTESKAQVIFVRHGHGCHNALDEQHTKEKAKRNQRYFDPPLTDCGRARSRLEGGALLEKIQGMWGGNADFYGTSVMLRAMETGLYMFPNATIFTLPFIKEAGSHHVSAAIEQQKDWMKRSRINWRYVDGVDENLQAYGALSAEQARHEVDYEAFKRVLGTHILPELQQQRRNAHGADVEADNFKLVIVSHGVALKAVFRTYFGCEDKSLGERLLFNNEAALVEYGISWHGKTAALTEKDGECQALLQTQSWNEDYLCPGDYQMCIRKNPEHMGVAPNLKDQVVASPWINTKKDQCCVQ